jgi:hypothetical protein
MTTSGGVGLGAAAILCGDAQSSLIGYATL